MCLSLRTIGADLAGLLGGRMASAEGGSVPRGVEYGEGCPLCSRLRGLGERRELPQRGPGQSPGRKRILAYFEGHRTLIFCTFMTKSGGGETICISVPRSKFWGDLFPLSFPRDLRPCPVPTRDPVVPMIFCPQYLGLLRAHAYTD